MGREYALLDGEDAGGGQGHPEHYLPIQAGGELPGLRYRRLRLHRRQDRYHLRLFRRRADPDRLGRSLCPAPLRHRHHQHHPRQAATACPCRSWSTRALDLLAAKLTRPRDEVQADVLEFFRGRFVNLLAERYPRRRGRCGGRRLASTIWSMPRHGSRRSPNSRTQADFEPLAVAFKRVCNIVKGGVDSPVDRGALPGLTAKRSFIRPAAGAERRCRVAGCRGRLPGRADRDCHPARAGRCLLRQGHGHGRGRTVCEPTAWPCLPELHGLFRESRISAKLAA